MTKSVGILLDRLMTKVGVDETKLSKATKIAKANISRLKNDPKANPTLATLRPLADFFGLTVSQLLGESPLSSDAMPQVASRIPIIGWNAIQDYRTSKSIKIHEWLSTEHKVSDHAFAIQINDKTMVPLFPADALLIIDKVSHYQDGMYVLVKQEDICAPFIKQYLIDGNTHLLKSLKIGVDRTEPLLPIQKIIGAIIEVRYRMEAEVSNARVK